MNNKIKKKLNKNLILNVEIRGGKSHVRHACEKK
jgi:hypothetical protein